MKRAQVLFAFWFTVVSLSMGTLTACGDEDNSPADDDDATGDDDDVTDDDDSTTDGDDATADDDDDDLPACEAIADQAECETRGDCYAFIRKAWWYHDATEGQCKAGEGPVYIKCLTKDDFPPGLGCTVFELASGVTAVFFQPRSDDPLFPQCGIETNDSACECCDGGNETSE